MLILYTRPGCPFCEHVLGVAQKLDVTIDERDISDEKNLKELLEKGGKQQVPFLIDEEKDVQLYESDDIIRYLVSRI